MSRVRVSSPAVIVSASGPLGWRPLREAHLNGTQWHRARRNQLPAFAGSDSEGRSKLYLDTSQPLCLSGDDINMFTDHKKAVEPCVRDRVGGRHLSVRVMALNDLEGRRSPSNSKRNLSCRSARCEIVSKAKSDLRLDARGDQ